MKIKLFSPQAIYELGKRTGQEDAIFPKMGDASEEDRLFIVCDGMGGHERGEVASQTVVQAMSDFIFQNTSAEYPFSDQLFEQALETAYLQLDKIDDGNPKKPGTTLTLLYLHRNGATVAHIGDSRIYHIRPEEGRVLYRSRDHSVVYDLYLAGEIEYDEMNQQPNKNIITKAMMPGVEQRQEANIAHIADIRPGDYFYLCSDGMLEIMSDEEIIDILASEDTDEQKRKTLIEKTAGNKDNHSAYLIHIDEVTMERRDRNLPDNEAVMMAKSVRRVDGANNVVAPERDDTTRVVPQGRQTAKAAEIKERHEKPTERQGKTTTRRSMLLPIITTAALLLILAGVYFTCGGSDDKPKKEVKTDPVDEPVKKPEKDTMNIAGGDTPKTQLPSPTDGLQQPEQKKPEDKKPEEKKPEDTNTNAAGNNEGNTDAVTGGNVTPTQPATPSNDDNQSAPPAQTAPPAPATPAAPPANTTPPPAQPAPPAQAEPRSVIPDE